MFKKGADVFSLARGKRPETRPTSLVEAELGRIPGREVIHDGRAILLAPRAFADELDRAGIDPADAIVVCTDQHSAALAGRHRRRREEALPSRSDDRIAFLGRIHWLDLDGQPVAEIDLLEEDDGNQAPAIVFEEDDVASLTFAEIRVPSEKTPAVFDELAVDLLEHDRRRRTATGTRRAMIRMLARQPDRNLALARFFRAATIELVLTASTRTIARQSTASSTGLVTRPHDEDVIVLTRLEHDASTCRIPPARVNRKCAEPRTVLPESSRDSTRLADASRSQGDSTRCDVGGVSVCAADSVLVFQPTSRLPATHRSSEQLAERAHAAEVRVFHDVESEAECCVRDLFRCVLVPAFETRQPADAHDDQRVAGVERNERRFLGHRHVEPESLAHRGDGRDVRRVAAAHHAARHDVPHVVLGQRHAPDDRLTAEHAVRDRESKENRRTFVCHHGNLQLPDTAGADGGGKFSSTSRFMRDETSGGGE